MQKLLTIALLATTVFGSVTPALAVTDQEAAEHNALAGALNRAGITLYLDADVCRSEAGLAGFYHSPSRSMVLCNKGSKEMTADNLDTLRHESIHAIQDCKNGVQGDSVLRNALKPGVVEQLAARSGLSLERIRQIYRSHGASNEVIGLEYEAWTGAATMSASTIATALTTMCAK